MGSLAFVSCADSGEVRCFAVDDTGRLREQQVLALGGMLMPLAQHPSLPRLYVARRSDPMAVITLSIADDGTLASLHEAALPDSMAYLSCDRQGHWLFSASYGGSLVAVSPIDPDGVAQHSVGTLPTGPNAHCIVPDPANRFVYSTALGADAVHRFRLEPSGLAPTQPLGHLNLGGAYVGRAATRKPSSSSLKSSSCRIPSARATRSSALAP